METLAKQFKAKSIELMPFQSELHDIDVTINDANQIDEYFFSQSEYLGGMAAVILAIIKN